MALSLVGTPTPTTPRELVLLLPEQPADAVKAWCRMVTSVDPTKRAGAWQFRGTWLDPGATYALSIGAVLVSCVQYSDKWQVTLATTTADGLDTVKEWTLKGSLGKRVVNFVARRLPADAGRHTARRLDPRPNQFEGRCRRCRQSVPANTGHLLSDSVGHYVIHKPGECLPPPEVVTPNRRGEPCYLCGHWVEPRTGVALRLAQPDGFGRHYRAAHQTEPGACPADARPGPTNQVPGWCAQCTQTVEPGDGYWDPTAHRRLLHAGECPTPQIVGPSWFVKRPRHEPAFEVGEVRRVRVDLRQPGNDAPVPATVPGYRSFSEHYVEFVGLVVEVVQHGCREYGRICPATIPEAADDLAADALSALAARPDAGGFTAGWSAERIGVHRPWLAELTGRDPEFGFVREFQTPQKDYTHANRKGTRGVQHHFVLLPNCVYEALQPISHRRADRVFLRATAEGDVVEITRDEVEAWLNHAATWHAS